MFNTLRLSASVANKQTDHFYNGTGINKSKTTCCIGNEYYMPCHAMPSAGNPSAGNPSAGNPSAGNSSAVKKERAWSLPGQTGSKPH